MRNEFLFHLIMSLTPLLLDLDLLLFDQPSRAAFYLAAVGSAVGFGECSFVENAGNADRQMYYNRRSWLDPQSNLTEPPVSLSLLYPLFDGSLLYSTIGNVWR